MDMSTQTQRPQYTVRYGAETEFFGANYPKALKFAKAQGTATIELADGTIIRTVGKGLITTSHEAQGLVKSELRAQGHDVDSMLSTQYGDVDQYKVWGSLSGGMGPFEAEVNTDGRFSIVAGAFGRLTHDGLDVFEGL